ncbi:MAG: tRNA pseudouridine(38-40) synthase TruA [Candidatus Omnitrophica bacterium]|nr:tRNA pseudouridine(38-40) synthase TruA [Candidatus Omnitrophota bacterium]
MRNLALTVSFDGTNYAGFQIQKNGKTVQEVLEAALRKILKEKVRILAAGRTDAGVHALAQVVTVKTSSEIPTEALKRALNSNIPPDIAVQQVKKVPLSFHPRYEAISKRYRYTIRNHPSRSPFDRLYTTFYPYPLDLSAMRRAARFLMGRRDYQSFQAKDKKRRSSTRHIRHLSIRKKSPYVVLEIEGDGFLYKMVRNIVGTLLEVGRGKWRPADVKGILSKKDRSLAGPTAPARGLCLLSVRYLS